MPESKKTIIEKQDQDFIYNVAQQATPYFLFYEHQVRKNIENYSKRNFTLYYSTKSCLFDALIQEIQPHLDGFSVSSVHDLKKIRKNLNTPVHFISPLIRDHEINAINKHGNSISFNSLEQFNRLNISLNPDIKKFMRINPEISFLDDPRYDPCREDSKLGVPLKNFHTWIKDKNLHIDGIQIHNNCQSKNPTEIEKTLESIESTLGETLHQFAFVNIGGGYIYSKNLIDTINTLSKKWDTKYKIRLIVEPSFDISNDAGYLVSSIVDLFESKRKKFVILDTSVNHLPEVLEYEYIPNVLGCSSKNSYSYVLGGATCLAGDMFGEHKFPNPLSIGEKIIFMDVGAYSWTRANKFNGIPTPNIFMLKQIKENYYGRQEL